MLLAKSTPLLAGFGLAILALAGVCWLLNRGVFPFSGIYNKATYRVAVARSRSIGQAARTAILRDEPISIDHLGKEHKDLRSTSARLGIAGSIIGIALLTLSAIGAVERSNLPQRSSCYVTYTLAYADSGHKEGGLIDKTQCGTTRANITVTEILDADGSGRCAVGELFAWYADDLHKYCLSITPQVGSCVPVQFKKKDNKVTRWWPTLARSCQIGIPDKATLIGKSSNDGSIRLARIGRRAGVAASCGKLHKLRLESVKRSLCVDLL